MTAGHQTVQRSILAVLVAAEWLLFVSSSATAQPAALSACPTAIPCSSLVGPGQSLRFPGFSVVLAPGGNAVTVSYDGTMLSARIIGPFGLNVDAPPAAQCQHVNGLADQVRCLAPQGEIQLRSSPPNPGTGMCSSTMLPAGWSLISGPVAAVVTTNIGPLYTYAAPDAAYRSPASASGIEITAGYWVLFARPTEVSVGCPAPPEPQPAPPASVTIPVVAGWTMIGNALPEASIAQIGGADIADVYDPQAGYQSTTTLALGQGAWVYSAVGGAVTLTAVR